jgi:CheY-like chemotaxis protein
MVIDCDERRSVVRVLVVEDEVKLASLIRRALREQGMLADVAITGEDALWMSAATAYDALVLDVNLPGIDGFEVVHRLRTDGIRTPILMLTARDGVDDRITGSTPALTITWSSRLTSKSCLRGCVPWLGGAQRSTGRS